jgi:ankyrin repeat protein
MYVQVASVLLEHGGSLTATTKKGFTPLHLAAKYGNLNVAKLLLQKDAPVDAQGKVSYLLSVQLINLKMYYQNNKTLPLISVHSM